MNGGSSSIKFAIFDLGSPPTRHHRGAVERIGLDGTYLRTSGGGDPDVQRPLPAADFNQAVVGLLDWLQDIGELERVTAVGHRIVHGGPFHVYPQLVTPELIADLRGATAFAPAHLPNEIQLIEALASQLPGVPQVVCFDTAFHHEMPRVARIVPIPRRYDAAGVRRYGFHGLSYAYLMAELARVAGQEDAAGRVILAHLGNGASLAAVSGGLPIDTTMGFTPASGLVMGTRTGDIDSGLVRYLARTEGMTAGQFDALVNHESGLLGVSETSSDVRDLLARQGVDVRAAEAIELFCYHSKKGIGAFAAVLGGVDTLVFAGGIGENATEIRRRICAGLGFLGITLDEERNASGAGLISTDRGAVKVRVIRTDEELMIAKSVIQLLGLDTGNASVQPVPGLNAT
jgi:acetate kinase